MSIECILQSIIDYKLFLVWSTSNCEGFSGTFLLSLSLLDNVLRRGERARKRQANR